jgi:hypothetical protein
MLYSEVINRDIRGFNVGEYLHCSLLAYDTVSSRTWLSTGIDS